MLPTKEEIRNYKKQRHFCYKLFKKERRKLYNNLNIKDITDNKNFWKTLIALLISDKRICGSSKINLVVDNKNLSDDRKIAETYNNYFNNAVKSLNLQYDPEHLNDVCDENNPIEIAIKSVKMILPL